MEPDSKRAMAERQQKVISPTNSSTATDGRRCIGRKPSMRFQSLVERRQTNNGTKGEHSQDASNIAGDYCNPRSSLNCHNVSGEKDESINWKKRRLPRQPTPGIPKSNFGDKLSIQCSTWLDFPKINFLWKQERKEEQNETNARLGRKQSAKPAWQNLKRMIVVPRFSRQTSWKMQEKQLQMDNIWSRLET